MALPFDASDAPKRDELDPFPVLPIARSPHPAAALGLRGILAF
jgi:hypothetical protein